MAVLGEKVQLKKIHPCGNDAFTVIRVGADIKLKCDKCGRIIMLSLLEFNKAVKNAKPTQQ